MKSGCRSCALAAASSSALGISRRKITHTSTSIWALPVRSAAPIALLYSASIRAWAHTRPIRQIVLTVTWTELKSSNAPSLVMAAANQRQARSSRGLGAVHDGHERSEFGRTQVSRSTAPPAWKKQTPAGRPTQQEWSSPLEPASKMAADSTDDRALGGNLRLIRSSRRRCSPASTSAARLGRHMRA